MKIGIVTTWFERGAAYVSRQYRDILKQDNDIFIYARGGEQYAIGDPNWDGPNVTWAKQSMFRIDTAIDTNEFEHWIITNKLDVVFFNEQHWWPAVLSANRTGVMTGSYIDYYTQETLPFFALFDFLICNTKRHHSLFSGHPAAHYIPWGTDINLFKPSNPGLANTDVLTFFHSAGINPLRKGCDLVIQAFERLRGPSRLVIHSQRDLKLFFPALASTISRLVEEGRLECHERTVSAPGLFHLGDVYVYPTRLEGIGLTIMEAGACGLPIIVTDDGPMNEFVLEGQNGALINVNHLEPRRDGYYWPQAICDLSSLAEKMQWYVDNMASIGVLKCRARNFAETNFDWASRRDAIRLVFRDAQHLTKKAPDIDLLAKLEEFESRRCGWTPPTHYERFRFWVQDKHPTCFHIASKCLDAVKSLTQAPKGK